MDAALQTALFEGLPPARLTRPAEPILRTAEVEPGSGSGPSCRFSLTRRWGAGPTIVIAGCNPSDADGRRDDPTMWREMAFAARWGFGGLVKINVYPVVASTLAGLRAWRTLHAPVQGSPQMIRNAALCAKLLGEADACWAAWGANVAPEDLAWWFRRLKRERGRAPAWQCLAVNGDGSPRHTLARGRHRIPDDAVLVPWRGWEGARHG